MTPREVYDVLVSKGATHLHHANSVTTSCTFLEQGALLSRDFVVQNHLIQTPQSSDADDQRYGIWDCIFLDHVDIHERGGARKGPNQYGPVLFIFNIDILLGLPTGTEIGVTKLNPIHWWQYPDDVDRWFQDKNELDANLEYGDFHKMLVIRTPSGRIDFPNHSSNIILDDPHLLLSSGSDAYLHAVDRLNAAGARGHVSVAITKRNCRASCICRAIYAAWPIQKVDLYFQ
ncbi:MAG: hypothetical protein WBZ48_08140 [Bacteroidota bacterium]